MGISGLQRQRPDMTNGDVLDALLGGSEALPDTPSFVLRDWIATIPDAALYEQARAAFETRFNLVGAFSKNEGVGDLREWRGAAYAPSVYITNEDGERRLLSPELVEELGLDSNRPQRRYRMPEGLDAADIVRWLLGEPPFDNQEGYAIWADWDGFEYALVKGQHARKR